jgi:hypothetical protein
MMGRMSRLKETSCAHAKERNKKESVAMRIPVTAASLNLSSHKGLGVVGKYSSTHEGMLTTISSCCREECANVSSRVRLSPQGCRNAAAFRACFVSVRLLADPKKMQVSTIRGVYSLQENEVRGLEPRHLAKASGTRNKHLQNLDTS